VSENLQSMGLRGMVGEDELDDWSCLLVRLAGLDGIVGDLDKHYPTALPYGTTLLLLMMLWVKNDPLTTWCHAEPGPVER
jgi:hypothetical protein